MAPGFLSLALLALAPSCEAGSLADEALAWHVAALDCSFVSSDAGGSVEPPADPPSPDPRPQAWLDEDDTSPDDLKTALTPLHGPWPARVFAKPPGAPQARHSAPFCGGTPLIYALGTLLL